MATRGSLAQLGEHLPYKQRVIGSNPITSTNKNSVDNICGNSSVVERHLAKVNVAGSNLVSRSNIRTVFIFYRSQWGKRGRRYSQAVRPRSAKPLSPGSNPGGASKSELCFKKCRVHFLNYRKYARVVE